MGMCYSVSKTSEDAERTDSETQETGGVETGGSGAQPRFRPEETRNGFKPKTPSPYRSSPFRAASSSSSSPFRPSPFRVSSPFRASPSPANGHATGTSTAKRPFPPPSPAKHIQAAIFKRHGAAKAKETAKEAAMVSEAPSAEGQDMVID